MSDEPQGDGAIDRPTPLSVSVRVSCVRKLNLADFQNAVPAFSEIAIANASPERLSSVVLEVQAEPAFIRSRNWVLDEIGAESTFHIDDRDVQVDGALLSRLTEAETATLRFVLRRSDTAGGVLATHDQLVELLPRTQWGGIGQLPEMVAAFVQPNDPAVDTVLKDASNLLRAAGKPGAIDGYTGGARRAWELSSAIWGAVQQLQITYALPPASFEHTGQKVRGPSAVYESRLGTCLDLAVLFAACLEQAHLHPLLVFTKGHAFVGLWLRDEQFSTPVVDDITALRKRLKLQELVCFETTLVTQEAPVAFKRAIDHAASQLSETVEDRFELAIDIRRARMTRIKPLAMPTAAMPGPAAAPAPGPRPSPVIDEPPDLPEAPADEPSAASIDPTDRLDRWQRRLLDLSLRNALLSFRAGKKSLPLEVGDPGQLEDALADGHALKLLCSPDLMDGSDPRSRELHEARSLEDVRREHARDALGRREILVRLPAEELESRLVELYRAARNALQEGGSNTLYVAIGFLVWNRTDKPEQRLRAPIVLLPVTLNRKSARSGFTLVAHEDEPLLNPTLVQMLRQDFNLDLGFGTADLPRDEHGLDVPAIWKRVQTAIKDIKGWEVSEDVALSMFSFAKYLMWKDLVDRTDQLRASPVVAHLIDTPRQPYPSTTPFPEPRRLDQEFSPAQTLCPLPADSSQLAAVMAAAKGKDFVLIGPPGTGKSQTIANLIAQCLADGKRVLFVAEKIAALEVVYRRLRQIGLGEFCLELHSSKARKIDVLEQFKQAWQARGEVDNATWAAEAWRLRELRNQLSIYVERLHHRYANGLTLYGAIGTVAGGEAQPTVAMSWASASTHDGPTMATLRDITDRLALNAVSVGPAALTGGPLTVVSCAEWTPRWQQQLIDAAAQVDQSASALLAAASAWRERVGLPAVPLHRTGRVALADLAGCLSQPGEAGWHIAPTRQGPELAQRLTLAARDVAEHRQISASMSAPWDETLISELRRGIELLARRDRERAALGVPWPVSAVEELERGLQLLEQLAELKGRLSVKYGSGVGKLNVGQLQRDWDKAGRAVWPVSWMGQRKVRIALEAVIEGTGEPRVAHDLATLVRIREVREEVAGITPGSVTEGIWQGVKTRVDLARVALRANAALVAARSGQPFSLDGLTPAVEGRCGERWIAELQRLGALLDVESAIERLDLLRDRSDGLWQGLTTSIDRLQAAIAFEVDRRRVVDRGALSSGHEAIASGSCGARLQGEHARLTRRGLVEERVARHGGLSEVTGTLWAGLDTDLQKVDRFVSFVDRLAPILERLVGAGADEDPVRTALVQWLSATDRPSAVAQDAASAGGRLRACADHFRSSVDQFVELAGRPDPGSRDIADREVADIAADARALIEGSTGLNAWCAWRKVRGEAMAVGLRGLVSALETRQVGPAALRAAFEVNYARWWLNAAVEDDSVIRTFVSAEHEKRVDEFRRLDEQFSQLTRAWIRAKLCAELPEFEAAKGTGEWGILRREIAKKRQHLPLRQLMSEIPSVVLRLTPCLLMSPLSIAQYLPADAGNFDLVVFDEASQIPVWDAIGAMARARQVVMVGDPKQLPPTSFFDRTDAEADLEDVEGDLESILDECLGASLPTRSLSWHYRSRHESLIAFSNHRYYGGGLVTFPSPSTQDRAVSFHLVNGRYEKGGARINKPEAHALVADLVGRLKSESFRASGLTIGVVTFNSEQQSLIEDLLDEERRKDPSIEPHFSETELEPVFVKNLESVQGDERDIMYFSITYGPDASGAVSMNFGPLNREGGERRLNVAVTRARHELRVFSSLKGEQMDLSRSQAAGVRDLKHFLEFAERGSRALAEADFGTRGDHESPFEEAVAAALVRRGWTVHTQIGASRFRIDLGVVHPDFPGRYLAGVECDGATYHRSATARDRDKLREQVLRGLGWEIVRVWSTDWWIDARGTLERLDQKLKTLVAADRERRLAAAAPPDHAAQDAERGAAETGAPTTSPSDGDGDSALERAAAEQAAQLIHRASVSSPKDLSGEVSPVRTRTVDVGVYAAQVTAAAPQAAAPPASRPRYVEAQVSDVVPPADISQDAFHEPTYDARLLVMVAHVIAVEGPVLDMVLARRIARAHGFQRTGSRIQQRVEEIARRVAQSTEESSGTFYWPPGVAPGAALPFRWGDDDLGHRDIGEICTSELLSLASEVLRSGARGDAAVGSFARHLGLQQIRTATRAKLELLLQMAAGEQPDPTGRPGASLS